MTVDRLAADTIRALAMDAVQRADSGHPGMPMGMADLAVVLWTRHLVVDPTDPAWPDRDRFVLSNGHGSMLLYSLLHVSGFDMTIDDLRSFRRLGSRTPGHPEREPDLGIEMTTGPLGQGFATAIGMAIAEEHLRAVFGGDLVDHRTYAFVGDGDLMEGISSEAASLAGHLGLGKVVCVYDDNGISIDGSTEITFTEDVQGRLRAMGWHTLEVDGHDAEAVDQAIADAKAVEDRPSLIAARTHIAFGAPTKQGTAEAHGSPLGDEEVAAAKRALGLPDDEVFRVPEEVRDLFRAAMEKGTAARRAWEERRDAALGGDPDLSDLWRRYWEPPRVAAPRIGVDAGEKMATRAASGRAINLLAGEVPNLLGGSADLAPSNNTFIDGSPEFQRGSREGRNFRFGVREHAMGAVVNGMAVHGGLRPYGGTFLVFSDYMRPAIRLAALMGAPSVFVFTHDSVFLGEDGPTHQPIEHLAALRAIPNLWVVRPASAAETAEAWELALARSDGPTALVLTRQPLSEFPGTPGGVLRGGYVVRDGTGVVLAATGSEVSLALRAAEILAEGGLSARVVSLPCLEVFHAQDEAYRREVLGDGLPVVSIEAASTLGWERITGGGLTIGIDRFGTSAPLGAIAEHFGFTPEAVAERVAAALA